jgi:hypothetical protein
MAQPIWQTPAGSLGTIPEEVFYSVIVRAVDPENVTNPVRYRLISGELPGGIQLSTNGVIEGVPPSRVIVQGVPFAVDEDVTSKFAIRAFTERTVDGETVVDRFADRTFTITVAGQDIPSFITPAGLVATFNDAGPASVQIEFFDNDIDDDLECSIALGALPPGLNIDSRSGLISGIIPPIAADTLYTFSVAISDGKSANLRQFSIQVNKSDITVPFLLNAAPSNIGTYRNDNFFAYQFEGFDFGGQTLEYVLVSDDSSLEIPPGTQLDTETGWLYGYIPDLGITELTYRFKIQVRELANPSVASPVYEFSINIIGFVDTNVVWITPENVGVINNGEISTLRVEAINFADRSLQYQLAPGGYPTPDTGVYNKLPQGLTLLSSGEIAGRTSFNTFSVDNGATTFDRNIRTRFVRQPTTFDLTYRFTVNARSPDGLINVFKEFVITVNRKYDEPFENLYCRAMPPQNDRDLLAALLQNTNIFPPNLIYRKDDLYFGIAKNVIYEHAFGLRSSTLEQYVQALEENHYWKALTLGSIEVAQARDSRDNIIYEVVYSRVIGGLLNDRGESVSKEVTWPYTIDIAGEPPIDTVYPNSLINMRDQVIDTVGQVDVVLPQWMTSKQQDGRVLGFTPAWVIAYVKPSFGQQIAYNVRTQFGSQLNTVDFKVDRYSLDRTMSKNWDPVTQQWTPPGAETSFDLELHYRIIDDSTIPGGLGYRVGDRIEISGADVGGKTPRNNILLTVNEVDNNGAVISTFCQGTAPLFSSGETFIGVAGNNIESGTNARFAVKRVNLAYFVSVANSGVGYTAGDILVISGSELGGSDTTNDCVITVVQTGVAGSILQISTQGTAAAGVEIYFDLPAVKQYGSGAEFDFVVASGERTVFDGTSLRFTAPVDNYTTSDEFDKYLVFPKRTILT